MPEWMSDLTDWDRILMNGQPFYFLFEVVFRTVVMFICLLAVLRLSGKRGVKQLSVYEVVIIIALGSAAGDPMFYHDVGLIPSLVVLVGVILMYRVVTWATSRFWWFEKFVEGKAVHLIRDGRFSVFKFEKEGLAQDEFFMELRQRGVEHLGQVRDAYLEANGDLSVYFFEDADVRPGLPVTPVLFREKSRHIPGRDNYACSNCGEVCELERAASCPVCKRAEWVKALSTKRVR